MSSSNDHNHDPAHDQDGDHVQNKLPTDHANNDPHTPVVPPPPMADFPVEIIEQILVHAIRRISNPLAPLGMRFQWPLPTWPVSSTSIDQLRQLLHVLPADWSPRVTCAAFLRFPHCTPVLASFRGRLDLLAMREKLAFPLTDIRGALYCATRGGHVTVLDWWRARVPDPLPVSWNLVEAACACVTGEPATLDWWLASGILVPEFIDDVVLGYGLDVATRMGHARVLEYAARQEYVQMPREHMGGLDAPSAGGFVEVLEWWRKSGMPVTYSTRALTAASEAGHVHVLEWWGKSGLQLKLPRDLDAWVGKLTDPKVVAWWDAWRERNGAGKS
ncbi:hypothetical protein AMAG_13693 [Allomyces macrogynus ATCC 38327]|uniref:Uncharacterized protein n=1 Tax=Allomyces macrogynus (strain ATCC 38327) TaxID=578462 RepID=A0A0L0T3N1_ALLM3|nr:hypothetical protein AMAG_13693 [Allomyces macrogynus ATCC 38327]|eukprot:KNE69321.1 hypothetical protein AMAG_13693 [Allomyces macrogynus ATCC 38327]